MAALVARPALAADDVYIGVSARLSGDNAEYGGYFKTAALLAQKTINDQGGVKGRKLQVLIEDSKADPKEAILIAQKFVSDPRVLAIVGDFNSSASMAASEIYNDGDLVQISPTASHPDFTKKGEYTFRAGTTQSMEGAFLARWAVQELGHRNRHTLCEQRLGSGGQQRIRGHRKALGCRGEQPGLLHPRRQGLHRHPHQAQGGQARSGVPGHSVGRCRSDRDPDENSGLQGRAHGSGLPEHREPGEECRRRRGWPPRQRHLFRRRHPAGFANFTRAYAATYGHPPHDHSALTYDLVMLLVNAMERGGFDRKAIRDALAKTDGFEGVTGKFRFDADRNPVKEFVKIMVKDGKWQIADNGVFSADHLIPSASECDSSTLTGAWYARGNGGAAARWAAISEPR